MHPPQVGPSVQPAAIAPARSLVFPDAVRACTKGCINLLWTPISKVCTGQARQRPGGGGAEGGLHAAYYFGAGSCGQPTATGRLAVGPSAPGAHAPLPSGAS